MAHQYRFRIQRLRGSNKPRFQLRMALADEPNFEYVPVHRTAFAKKLSLEVAHPSPLEAQLELSNLLEWLNTRAGLFGNADFTRPGG